jgi:predicted RNase H-like HicB family nuclease
MKQRFTAVVSQEDEWYIAQCLEVDVASQGESELTALGNLREALELHFEEPRATIVPSVQVLEIEVSGD